MFGDIELVANVTNFMIFLVFLVVNLCLIYLAWRRQVGEVVFRTPLRISDVPVSAVLGVFSSSIMLMQFDFSVVVIALLMAALGAGFYRIFKRQLS